MAFRARLLSRAFHASRAVRAAEGPGSTTEHFNEPGGRLFGEAIRQPGERRKLFDWEVPYIGTLVLAGLMLGFGLNSRPETSALVWAREEALARLDAAEKAEGGGDE
ncbi:unnamed protein product [Chondrus crispus]|uniref:Complex I-ESSS n=1 Tax=Chondrus crispus TaxID=2769 RepID=R7QA24_CHOCR|nr:unnamed protein product [Chondrus crispus]CDF34618.1 unnamed protein product [Chondrus crispus]|eukprot:XP_005714437.1 unnamed protein product [Chondrus crispus]